MSADPVVELACLAAGNKRAYHVAPLDQFPEVAKALESTGARYFSAMQNSCPEYYGPHLYFVALYLRNTQPTHEHCISRESVDVNAKRLV